MGVEIKKEERSMKILKFAALIAGMFVLNLCIPYGYIVNMGIIAVALWKLV